MPTEQRPGMATSPEDLIELLQEIWVQIDPDQKAEWRGALQGLDLEVAEQAIIILRDASQIKPSVKLFQATYRGLNAKQIGSRASRTAWFEEQRAKLRLAGQEPGAESHRAS
jgi:hypothetical protein